MKSMPTPILSTPPSHTLLPLICKPDIAIQGNQTINHSVIKKIFTKYETFTQQSCVIQKYFVTLHYQNKTKKDTL